MLYQLYRIKQQLKYMRILLFLTLKVRQPNYLFTDKNLISLQTQTKD